MNNNKHKKITIILMGILLIFSTAFFYFLSPPIFTPIAQTGAVASAFLCSPKAAYSAAKNQLYSITEDENGEIQLIFHTNIPETENNVQTTVSNGMRPQNAGIISEAHYAAGTGKLYIQSGAGSIKNLTSLSSNEITPQIMQPLPFEIELNSQQPQVLIMHTHATESYECTEKDWYDPNYTARNTDCTQNMVAVGAELAAVLNAGGINTIQDSTLHDYPSYTGSYQRSKKTVESYLAQYPSIKVVLDVHRDAIERDGERIKPVTIINGMKAAQVMIICGADDGTMGMPNYMQNLRFASRLQNSIESMYPTLTRPVLFDYRNYNQQLTTGSLLLEFGGHANTLEEAKYTARLVGDAMVSLFTNQS